MKVGPGAFPPFWPLGPRLSRAGGAKFDRSGRDELRLTRGGLAGGAKKSTPKGA